MAANKKAMSTVKQIIRLHADKKGIKTIARICSVSKNTIKRYVRAIETLGISLDYLLQMDDYALEELFVKSDSEKDTSRYTDFLGRCDYWQSELKRVGVTRQLLWEEYILEKPNGYQYSQFCYLYERFLKRSQSSMVMVHQPGQRLFIDFTGKKMSYYDPLTGEEHQAEILVACLGASQKAFVMALASQRSEDFIYAMTKILGCLGGCTQAIVPDNMKTAVIKSDRYEPSINRLFEDFANHYQTTIIPTRALHPKDKALAESLVKIAYTRVYAPLRNHVFTNLQDMNLAIQAQIDIHNATLFQRKEYSRNDLFEQNEKHTLIPLPAEPFQIMKHRQYTIQKNSHFILTEDSHYYSVPYAYIGQKVDVTYTHTQVYVYLKGKQLAQHIRNITKHAYTSVSEHLPSQYQDYKDRSPEYYLQKAGVYSKDLKEVISHVLHRKLLVEQNYKSCDGILSLSRRTPREIFENACKMALTAEKCNYRFMDMVIQNGAAKNYQPQPEIKPSPEHDNIRGKSYFLQLIQLFL